MVFLLSIVFEITVFEISMVDSLRFALEKKKIYRLLCKRLGSFYPERNTREN